MQISDQVVFLLVAMVVSFSLAEEIRDITLCQITISNRAGAKRWRPHSLMDWALLFMCVGISTGLYVQVSPIPERNMSLPSVRAQDAHRCARFDLQVFVLGQFLTDLHSNTFWVISLTTHALVISPACAVYIDIRSGNTPWRVFLLLINAVRQFGVVPLLAATVPSLVLYGSSNAKNMALNTVRYTRRPEAQSQKALLHCILCLTLDFLGTIVQVSTLFILGVDNLAFRFALPDAARVHVEEYGRAELDKREMRLVSAVKTWTWLPMLIAMVAIVMVALLVHDPHGGWLRGPDWLAGGPNGAPF
jgi:hypothetical protein